MNVSVPSVSRPFCQPPTTIEQAVAEGKCFFCYRPLADHLRRGDSIDKHHLIDRSIVRRLSLIYPRETRNTVYVGRSCHSRWHKAVKQYAKRTGPTLNMKLQFLKAHNFGPLHL
jgi:hypothetical protein